ncbi:RNA polymerase sigma factor [Bacteroidota bacterium]
MGLEKYVSSLIVDAQKGHTRSFLDLVGVYYKQVYQLIYQLHPEGKHAEEITAEVFIKAWKNIKAFKEDSDFLLWLKELALIVIYFHLKSEEPEISESDEFEHDFISLKSQVFTKQEISFLELPVLDKISLKLYDELGYNFDKISDALSLINSGKAKEVIVSSERLLVQASEYKILTNLNNEQWNTLIEKMKSDEDNLEIISEEDDVSIIKEYNDFKNSLKTMFKNIEAPEDLVKKIKEELLREREREVSGQDLKVLSKKEREKLKRKLKLKEQADKAVSDLAQSKKLSIVSESKVKKEFSAGKILYVVLPVILVGLLLYYFLVLSKINEPWLISNVTGNYKINGSISNSTSISENDMISTDAVSRLDLTIPAIADIKLLPNTELQLIKAFDEDNVIKLDKGQIELSTKKVSDEIEEIADYTNVMVQTKFGNLKTESADYNIKTIDQESCLVQLSKGWAEFESPKEKVYLATGYELNISLNTQYPIPYFVNASPEIKSAIIAQDYPLYSSKTKAIIGSAELEDMLTLWHFLKHADKGSRDLIVDFMEEYIPILDESIKNKLIDLQEDYLLALLGYIRIDLTYNNERINLD